MARGARLLVALGLLAGPGWVWAEDTYTIKIKQSVPGDSAQVERQSTEHFTMKVTDSQGKKLQEKDETTTKKLVYLETILEKQQGRLKAGKLRRRYEKATVKTGDDIRTLPYEGKSLLIEKKGDRYHFQVEGGEELTGKAADELNSEFNKPKDDKLDFEKIMLPKKPVRVNESWTIDAKELLQGLEDGVPVEIDAAKAKASAKLVKAYQQDGRQFGVVELHLEFPLKALKMGEQKAAVEEGAKMDMTATMDGCIDGTLNSGKATYASRMEVQAEVAQGGNKFKLSLTHKLNGQDSDKEVIKK